MKLVLSKVEGSVVNPLCLGAFVVKISHSESVKLVLSKVEGSVVDSW
jgi:hypothetical protein